ncbi:MAG TPA: hypothetical protein PLZ67_06425 [Bacteroidales bacterium]|nr:hypothetical protein [Bacteroidales bacterium]
MGNKPKRLSLGANSESDSFTITVATGYAGGSISTDHTVEELEELA